MMLTEPTVDEIEKWLLDHWVGAFPPSYFKVATVLDARAALLAERRVQQGEDVATAADPAPTDPGDTP